MPPIQNYLVDKTAEIASRKTKMNISVGHVSLSFPLDLVMNDVKAISSAKDTLLEVDRLQVNVQLLPLLKKDIEIDGISIKHALVNSMDLIHGMTIKGRLGEFYLSSHGVKLDPETAIVDNVLLKNSNISLSITDTTSTDTTKSAPTYWKFLLKKIDVQNVAFDYSSPLTNSHINTHLDKIALRNGYIDLHKQLYSLQTLYVNNGKFRMNDIKSSENDTLATKQGGIDPSDIRLSDINIQVDSLFYKGNNIKANIRNVSLKETNSKLNVISVKGDINSNDRTINVSDFEIKTTDSYFNMLASIDWNAFESKNPGIASLRLKADIGKPDMIRLMGGADEKFIQKYPSMPLKIVAGVDGNMESLNITSFHATLPQSFDIMMDGKILHAANNIDRDGQISLNAKSDNIEFLAPLAGGMVIPSGTSLNGTFLLKGTAVNADFLLKQFNSAIVNDSILNNDSLFSIPPVEKELPSIKEFHDNNALRMLAFFDWDKESYEIDLSANEFDLNKFFPNDTLSILSAKAYAKGDGFDIFSKKTSISAKASIRQFEYGSYDLAGLNFNLSLSDNNIIAETSIDNNAMNILADVEGLLEKKRVKIDLNANIKRLDWQELKLADVRFQTSQQIKVTFDTNMEESFSVDASMINTTVTAPKRQFKTKDLYVGLKTNADSTFAYAKAGDLDFSISSKEHLNKLSDDITIFLDQLLKQWEIKHIDQVAIKKYLPYVCMTISAGKDNPIYNYLSLKGIAFDKLFMDIDSSPLDGINGSSYIYGLHNDSLALDTIYLDIEQDVSGIKFYSGVTSVARKNQEAFDASLEGSLMENKAQLLFQYFNGKKEQGVYLGLMADLYQHGINLHLFPKNPTIVYRPFNLNTDNYIFLGNKGKIHANVRLIDDNGSGLSFFTYDNDSTTLQDMTLELANINLDEIRRILPYMPDMQGKLGGDLHYIKTMEHSTFSSTMQLNDFVYEKTPLGDWEMNGVYMPGDNNDHHIDGFITRDGNEIIRMNGLYLNSENGSGSVNASVELEKFPLDIINPFVPDKSLEFTGDFDGTLSMKGSVAKPQFNGNLSMDSVTLFMPELSARFRFDNRPVRVVDSKMTFDKFKIFTKGNNPFTIDGYVDLTDFSKINLNLEMNAKNYELINSPRSRRSIVYGKMYVDFDARLRGPIQEMNMRGNMNILGKTNFTYVMKDSPLTVNDRLNDMVTFVNFKDSVVVDNALLTPVSINGMDIALTLHIDQAVQARVDLTADGSNYMMLEGGGDLAFQYTPQGNMVLNGRYSLISGEMKYQIPVIPLKTFYIQNGSYLEWTGNPLNPTMSIVATEPIRANVSDNGQTGRMVTFNVGVDISNNLENPGLAFILSAADDGAVQEQLNAMSEEERGKLAVTMLVTGIYAAEGNSTGGFNVNNTLNSFLQSEISNVVGKTMDINLGMETVNDGEGGSKRTDYNFQFAKRFWNNRFRIVIGGKVSTGNTAQQDESFIDNISVEYRLDNSGTRYIRFFYDKNYDSVLEGEITETGLGVVLRKKMSRLGELFIFKRRKDNVTESQ